MKKEIKNDVTSISMLLVASYLYHDTIDISFTDYLTKLYKYIEKNEESVKFIIDGLKN